MPSQCDCCARLASCCSTVTAFGLETAACCRCRGFECDDCAAELSRLLLDSIRMVRFRKGRLAELTDPADPVIRPEPDEDRRYEDWRERHFGYE